MVMGSKKFGLDLKSRTKINFELFISSNLDIQY